MRKSCGFTEWNEPESIFTLAHFLQLHGKYSKIVLVVKKHKWYLEKTSGKAVICRTMSCAMKSLMYITFLLYL